MTTNVESNVIPRNCTECPHEGLKDGAGVCTRLNGSLAAKIALHAENCRVVTSSCPRVQAAKVILATNVK